MPLNAKQASQHVAVQKATILPANSYLTLITSLKSLERLEEGWRALEKSSVVPATIFQSYDWVKTWCEIYAQPESQTRVMILAGYTNNQLVFVLPTCACMTMGVNRMHWLSQPIGQYGDILCESGHDPVRWMDCAIDFIKNRTPIDLLHLRHLRQTSNLQPFAVAKMCDGKLDERAPYFDFTSFKTPSDFEARYDAKQRKHRKQARNRLEKLGPINFIKHVAPDQINRALNEALDEKLIWLKENGQISQTLTSQEHRDFLKALAHMPNSSARLQITEMTVGTRNVAWEAALIYEGIQYCYLISRVSDLKSMSPGRLHFEYSQATSYNMGHKIFDLMVPFDDYKASLSSAMEPVNDFYLPLTVKGKIYGHFYLGQVRPVLRKLYTRLPTRTLRILKTLLRQ